MSNVVKVNWTDSTGKRNDVEAFYFYKCMACSEFFNKENKPLFDLCDQCYPIVHNMLKSKDRFSFIHINHDTKGNSNNDSDSFDSITDTT